MRHVTRFRSIGRFLALILPTALLGVLAYSSIMAPYGEARTIGEGVGTFTELSDRFAMLAKNEGGEYAFEVLRRAKLPPNTDLHLLGHVVGDELYAQKGVDGIADCTQDFRNACSHSIVIGALNEFGEEALSMIRDACTKAPGGPGAYTMCFHGLGHGVFAYYEYSIPETVRFCETTGTPAYNNREYVECVGGMIMELMGGGGHDKDAWLASREKYLSRAEPLAPCDTALIPERTKPMCYTYLTPRLWELVGIELGTPNSALFDEAFALCEKIPEANRAEREACYGGFGKEFVPIAGARDIRDISNFSDEEFLRVISWCQMAQSDEGVAACLMEGLASIFWGGENDPDASFRFCGFVPEGWRPKCFESLASNIRVYIPDPTVREDLCERVPPEAREACMHV